MKFHFVQKTQWYQPGEEVSFTLEAVPGLEALEISAYGIKDTTAMELTRSLEKDQISISFDQRGDFHFEMPESDIFADKHRWSGEYTLLM